MGSGNAQSPHFEDIGASPVSINSCAIPSAAELGALWLKRFRRIEGSNSLPRLEPLNEVLLSLDFFWELSDDGLVKPTKKDASDNEKELEISSSSQNDVAELGSTNVTDIDLPFSNQQEGIDAQFVRSDIAIYEHTNHIRRIPPCIANDNEYIGYFLPLLLEEAKQLILRAWRVEVSQAEIFTQIRGEASRNLLSLVFAKEVAEGGVRYSEGDLLLITTPGSQIGREGLVGTTKARDTESKGNRFFCEKEVEAYMLGLVQHATNKTLVVQVASPSLSSDAEGPEGNPARGPFTPEFRKYTHKRMRKVADVLNASCSRWSARRLLSLTTIHREFQGLMSVPDLVLKPWLFYGGDITGDNKFDLGEENPLFECIENHLRKDEKVADVPTDDTVSIPKHGNPSVAYEAESLVITDKLHDALKKCYNDSQFAALQESLKVQGVTLVQGPPGTGKTSTIIGVLSVLLHSEEKSNTAANPSEASRRRGERQFDTENAKKKSKELSLRRHPWLAPGFVPWMDIEECTLEDLEERSVLMSASVPTGAPVIIKQQQSATKSTRVLVCAPSNAAIDEIVKRLVAPPADGGGILDGYGRRFTPSVIRVGPNIHPDLIGYSLEYHAAQTLKAQGSWNVSAVQAAKAEILNAASIVCTTLSSCGSRELYSMEQMFDTVVVDEASQGVEVSTLIPLRHGCRRLILVGDPNQLPATIFSRTAIQLKYGRSLFERLEGAGYPKHMLSVQYRMHPYISVFPCSQFYNGQLKDADDNLCKFTPPFSSWYEIPILKPFVFFNIDSEHEEKYTSLINPLEARFVGELVSILRLLVAPTAKVKWEGRLAIITPYAEQVNLLRKTVRGILGIPEHKACPVDINTIDGFQGQEKDFVIFSAVRGLTSEKRKDEKLKAGVGFLSDARRLNVAITRGRLNVWVIGNGSFLRRNSLWDALYKHARSVKGLVSISNKKLRSGSVLSKWLFDYCNKNEEVRTLILNENPSFMVSLTSEVKRFEISTSKEQCDSAASDDEMCTVETNGKTSWELPEDEEYAGTDTGTNFSSNNLHDNSSHNGGLPTFHDMAVNQASDTTASEIQDEAKREKDVQLWCDGKSAFNKVDTE